MMSSTRPLVAEMTKHGQSRALPLRPIGGIAELPKIGQSRGASPYRLFANLCTALDFVRFSLCALFSLDLKNFSKNFFINIL